MADFDAGSIEGKLDLDTSPFVEGLQKAKAEAKKFENSRYTATVSTHYESDGEKPDDTGKDESSTVKIGADDSEAQRKIAEVEAELEALDHQKADPKVDVETSTAISNLRKLNSALDNVIGNYKKGSAGSGAVAGHGMMALVGMAAALAPAFGPAVPAIGALAGAFGAGLAEMGVSLGLFMGVAVSDFATIQDAIKNGLTLTGPAGEAQKAFMGLKDAWGALKKATAGPVFGTMTKAFTLLSGILPKLAPLVNATAKGLQSFLEPLQKFTLSPAFQRFLDLLTEDAGPALKALGGTATSVLGGIFNLIEAINPITDWLSKEIESLAGKFESWSNGVRKSGINDFFDSLKKSVPPLLHMLHELGGGLKNIFSGFGPLVGPATRFLTQLGTSVGKLHLQPLTHAVGELVDGLAPFVKVLGNIINTLLPPFSKVLHEIVHSAIGPLGESLSAELNPALRDLRQVLNKLAPWLGKIAASFADLVNPTGVGLFTKLIHALKGPVETLIPPVSRLIIALESMVDKGLNAVAGAIPGFGSGLQGAADAIAPLIDALAWFVDHESVALTILAIVAAIKGLVLISRAYVAIQAAWTALQVAWTAAMIGGSVAAGEGALSLGLYLAAATASAIGTGIATVATAAWAAAVWVLDAALAVLTSPITLVIAAIALLAIGIYEAYKHVGWFHTAVDAVGNALKTAFFATIHAAVAVFHFLSDAVGFVKDHLELLFLLLGPFGAAIIAVIEIVKHWSDILGVVQDAFHAVVDFFKHVGTAIGKAFVGAAKWLLDAGKDIINGLWKGIKAVWNREVKTWEHIGKTVRGWFDGAISWLRTLGGNIISGLWSGMRSLWNREVSGWERIGSTIKGWFTGAISWLRDLGGNIISGLYSGIQTVWNREVTGWENIGSKVKGWFLGAIYWLSSAGHDIIQGLWNGITEVWNRLTSWFSSVAGTFGKIFSVANKIFSPSRVFHDLGANLMQGLHDGIKKTHAQLVVPLMEGISGKMSEGFDIGDSIMAGETSIRISAMSQQEQFRELAAAVTQADRERSAAAKAEVARQAQELRQARRLALEDHRKTKNDLIVAFKAAVDHQTDKIIKAQRTGGR